MLVEGYFSTPNLWYIKITAEFLILLACIEVDNKIEVEERNTKIK